MQRDIWGSSGGHVDLVCQAPILDAFNGIGDATRSSLKQQGTRGTYIDRTLSSQ